MIFQHSQELIVDVMVLAQDKHLLSSVLGIGDLPKNNVAHIEQTALIWNTMFNGVVFVVNSHIYGMSFVTFCSSVYQSSRHTMRNPFGSEGFCGDTWLNLKFLCHCDLWQVIMCYMISVSSQNQDSCLNLSVTF